MRCGARFHAHQAGRQRLVDYLAKRCRSRVGVYSGHLSFGSIRVVTFMLGRIAAVLVVIAALALSAIFAPTLAVADERDAWAALVKGGHVALVRHGSAPPGYGDPPGFKIEDCARQRNMDERGRQQSRALGEAFRPARRSRGPDHLLAVVPLLGNGATYGSRSR